MSNKIGLITEQGDLGFGFDPLSQKDNKIYQESSTNTSKNDTSNDKKEDK